MRAFHRSSSPFVTTTFLLHHLAATMNLNIALTCAVIWTTVSKATVSVDVDRRPYFSAVLLQRDDFIIATDNYIKIRCSCWTLPYSQAKYLALPAGSFGSEKAHGIYYTTVTEATPHHRALQFEMFEQNLTTYDIGTSPCRRRRHLRGPCRPHLRRSPSTQVRPTAGIRCKMASTKWTTSSSASNTSPRPNPPCGRK